MKRFGRTSRVGWLRAIPFALLLACAGNSVSGPDLGEPPPGALRVLFIGNSLTYVNDLPALVGAIADSLHVERTFWYRTAAEPNYGLEDHWVDSRTRDALRSMSWDVVVLQQGPSSLPESRVNLLEWSGRFAAEIRNANGQPALYMVWPESSRQTAFTAVSDNYTAAADAVNGMLFPAGRAWLLAWERDATLPLYGPDGFHPSALGTYLAALVIVDRLYGADLDALPDRILSRAGITFTVGAETRVLLTNVARAANRDWGR